MNNQEIKTTFEKIIKATSKKPIKLSEAQTNFIRPLIWEKEDYMKNGDALGYDAETAHVRDLPSGNKTRSLYGRLIRVGEALEAKGLGVVYASQKTGCLVFEFTGKKEDLRFAKNTKLDDLNYRRDEWGCVIG